MMENMAFGMTWTHSVLSAFIKIVSISEPNDLKSNDWEELEDFEANS
jgi:hypothetical protein